MKTITGLLILFLLAAAFPAQAVVVNNPADGFFVSWKDNSPQGVMVNIIGLLLGIVGTLSVLFIIIGGFQYITSGSNEDLAKQGKKTFQNAVVGLVIVLLSYIIVVVVTNTLY